MHLVPYFDGATLERADGAKGHTSLGPLQNECKDLAFEALHDLEYLQNQQGKVLLCSPGF